MAHSGWTPEPWEWDQTGYADVEVFREDPDATDDGDGVVVIAEVAYYGDVDRMTANARRIVACVNACRGIPTEALEAGVLQEMRGAMVDVEEAFNTWLKACPIGDYHRVGEKVQAALRKARGEEAAS